MAVDQAWRFDHTELDLVREVLESGWLSARFGEVARRFEQEFAAKFGAKYAIAVNSGTSTLHMAVAAAGVGPGDEVIVPPFTVVCTPAAVIHHNGIPVFADIDPDTFNIDPEDIKRKITPRTKAIIPVPIFGLTCEMDPIMEIAEKYGLTVIEDCAQTYLSEYKGRYAGALGHIGSFSLEQTKHITTGDGGMLITSDEKLAIKMRQVGDHGVAGLTADDGRFGANVSGYEIIGWNYRMPEVVAAVGLAQLRKLDRFLASRREVASYYGRVLDKCEWIRPQLVPEYATHTYYAHVSRFVPEKAPVTRDRFKEILAEEEVASGWCAWRYPAHMQPAITEESAYGGKFGCPTRCPHAARKVEYGQGVCPVAESIHQNLLHFGTCLADPAQGKANAERLARAIARAEAEDGAQEKPSRAS